MRLKSLRILLLILILPLLGSYAGVKKLSQTAKISLLTCGQGEAVYSKFGHSALWVYDPMMGIDRIYNYGTFDFYSSDFYVEFLNGTALYRLSITNFLNFYSEYESENRSIIEQELNLSFAEKQVLFEKLEDNYKPENRYYRYDFLFQNCSSLIRDIVWEATDNRFAIPDESEEKYTYRSMMIPYLKASPWSGNGMLMLLGHRTDNDANPWDQMYLPDFMLNWFDLARDQEGESLVSKTQTLFLPAPERKNTWLTHPAFLLSLVILVVLYFSFLGIRNGRKYRLIDTLIFLISGLVGILMLYMWINSEHIVTHQNLVLIWAFPLHFLLIILVWFRKSHKLIKNYSRIMAPISLLYLAFFWILPQSLPPLSILLGILVIIRLVFWTDYKVVRKIIK